MISISAFKSFPEIPKLAFQNGLHLEYTGLVDPITYEKDYLDIIKNSEYFRLYNSVHGPFYDLMPPSQDIEVSNLARTKIIRAIEACHYLGIKNIIFHNGWIKDFYSDSKWIDNSIKFWSSILEVSKSSVVIHLENVMENRPLLIKEIVKGINSQYFQICLDIGHVNVFSKISIKDWITELSPDIKHVHIHNNYGKIDNHNGLLEGKINIKKTIELLSEKCPKATINMEIRSHINESIEWIKKKNRNFV